MARRAMKFQRRSLSPFPSTLARRSCTRRASSTRMLRELPDVLGVARQKATAYEDLNQFQGPTERINDGI